MTNARLHKLSLYLAALMFIPQGHAEQPALTGYDSDNTIPYSLFDDTEKDRPWITPPATRAPPVRPATTEQARQQQRVHFLEKSLSEQQSLYEKLLEKNASEKQSLQQQLRESEIDREAMAAQRERLGALQRALAEAQAQHGNADQQLSDLRAQLAAYQLLEDTRTLTQPALENQLKEKESRLLAITQQLDELKADNAALRGKQQPVKLQTREQKTSYANGVAFANDIVQSLRAQQEIGVAPDRPMVLAGLRDAFAQRIILSREEVASLVSDLDRQLNEKVAGQQQQQTQMLSQQQALGKELMKQTQHREGVQQMDGAYYFVTKKGKGAMLNAGSTAELLITGKLADGTLFDSSGEQNDVQRVNIDTLLPAIRKIISQENVGSELEIILPPELAFGEQGAKPSIPPGATLIFTIKIKGTV